MLYDIFNISIVLEWGFFMDASEIMDFFRDCVLGKKVNGQIQLLRIYGSYQREQECILKDNPIADRLKDSKCQYTIHRISDDMAIVEYHDLSFSHSDTKTWFSPVVNDRIDHTVYDSMDKALIGLITFKKNDQHAAEYIFKMLDM